MNRHFAFVGRDGAGHVNPTLPLVTELVRRGHRVTYAVGAPYAGAVQRAGARHLPLPGNDFRGGRSGQNALPNADTDVVAMLTDMVIDGSDRELLLLREGFAADRPDAVCYDGSSLSGAMLADYAFVGPSGHDRVESGDWNPPGAGLVFIALGTMVNRHPEFFRLCIEAFAGTGRPVAMAIGNRVDRAELGDIPAGFDVRPYFPQLQVLQHAAVFVTHAGMNSTMEAVLNQVPTVAVPQRPQQRANARRLAELGLGTTLTEPTAAALRREVDEPDRSEPVRKNLAEMAAAFRAAGGAPAAADAIGKLTLRQYAIRAAPARAPVREASTPRRAARSRRADPPAPGRTRPGCARTGRLFRFVARGRRERPGRRPGEGPGPA